MGLKITNGWAGHYDGVYYFIFAGATPVDPTMYPHGPQPAIAVGSITDPARLGINPAGPHIVAGATGTMTLVNEDPPRITLRDSTGKDFTYSLSSHVLTGGPSSSGTTVNPNR